MASPGGRNGGLFLGGHFLLLHGGTLTALGKGSEFIVRVTILSGPVAALPMPRVHAALETGAPDAHCG